MDAELDAAALRYVLAARPVFEALKGVLAQLAGFALLKAVGLRDANLQDTPLTQARTALAPALDGLKALRPPAAAVHHHRHLGLLAEALEQALARSEANLIGTRMDGLADAARPHLEAATGHMRAASRLLPGFEVVSLAEACCACHPADIVRARPAA